MSDPAAGEGGLNLPVADEVAALLVTTGAVAFQASPFFTFTSGTRSPVYVDNRRLLGFLAERRRVVEMLCAASTAETNQPEAIAGTATAGIAWAAWIAEALSLPMMYVRSAAKGWGRQRAIEGVAEPGARVVLTEDLAFTGQSVAAAVTNLRDGNYDVSTCVSIVSYSMPFAESLMAEHDVSLTSLTTIDNCVTAAESKQTLEHEEATVVREWLAEQRGKSGSD